MKNLNLIAEELFNKIRGRFPSVTVGDAEGNVTNKPEEARFYDFDYTEGDVKLGKVSISLADDAVEVMYSNDFVATEDSITRQNWYNFLKELRSFSKKRLLKFDTRNINKSNLDKRDYKFLATNRTGDETMTESKMYGTSKTSYQNVGEARIAIKHTKPVNTESVTGRIQNIGSIYIESADGERFKYPFKHLNGARAMARHVAEGGKPYDDFGKHITGLSEELSSLKKFKSYMNRSSVMAEGLSDYIIPVNDRVDDIKKTITSLQKESFYKEAFEGFEAPIMEDVPEDVAENWIDQLTIRQFNEDLKDVFPYVYRLVSEVTRAKTVDADDLLGEGPIDWIKGKLDDRSKAYDQDLHVLKTVLASNGYDKGKIRDIENSCLNDPRVCLYNEIRKKGLEAGDMDMEVKRIGDDLNSGWTTRSGTTDEDIDRAFDEMMGQFSEKAGDDCDESCPKSCPDCGGTGDPEKYKAMQKEADAETDEGNAFTKALAKAKANNDDEMEVDGKKIPVTEFVLSMYDRETGQFPKGETAVLTAVEKDYGEQFINPAKQFIEAINAKFEEINGYKDNELGEEEKTDIDNYFTKSNPELLKKQQNFLKMTNEFASRRDLPIEELKGIIQYIKPSSDDGDFLKFARRALIRLNSAMRIARDPRTSEVYAMTTEYMNRVLEPAIKREYNPDQNDPRGPDQYNQEENDIIRLAGL
jgi:hypothetical protein